MSSNTFYKDAGDPVHVLRLTQEVLYWVTYSVLSPGDALEDPASLSDILAGLQGLSRDKKKGAVKLAKEDKDQ